MNAVEVRAILKHVKYLDWIFFVAEKPDGSPDYLQLQFEAPCTTTGQEQGWKGRKWPLSQHMTVSEIVTTAFKAVMTAIEHEARESFLYQEQPIFGPHINVSLLVQLYQHSRTVLDVRKNPGEQHGPIQENSQPELELALPHFGSL